MNAIHTRMQNYDGYSYFEMEMQMQMAMEMEWAGKRVKHASPFNE